MGIKWGRGGFSLTRLWGRGDAVISEGNFVLSKSGIIGGKLAFPSGLVVIEKE